MGNFKCLLGKRLALKNKNDKCLLCALFLPWAVIKSRKLRANTTNYYDIHLLKEICYLGESLNRIIST